MGQKQGKEKRPSATATGTHQKRPSHHPPAAATAAHKRPSETGSSLTNSEASSILGRKASSQIEDLNMYAKRSAGSIDGHMTRKTSSTASEMRRGSSHSDQGGMKQQPPSNKPSTETINEDVPQQRKTLFDHLVAFYFRNDHDRLMNGDVDIDGICDWALAGSGGIAALNEKLLEKYGEDLDSFLINAATETEENKQMDIDEEGSMSGHEGEQMRSGSSVEELSLSRPTTPSADPEPTHLGNNAAMERPAIPMAARRRKTNTPRFELDANGELAASESVQLDHAPPPDLHSQLRQFVLETNPARESEVDKFVSFANEHGLIALNSELLVEFGKDLKGNTMESKEVENHHLDIKKYGVGFDSPLLSEMQNFKLQHADSGRIQLEPVEPGTACGKFRLDTESPIFGMCKCGFERAAHMKRGSVIASGTLERKLAERRASINIEASISEPKPPKPVTPHAPSAVEAPKPLRGVTPRVQEVSVPHEAAKPPRPTTPKVDETASSKPPRPTTPKVDETASSKPPRPTTPKVDEAASTKPPRPTTPKVDEAASAKPPPPSYPKATPVNAGSRPRPPRPKSVKLRPASVKKGQNDIERLEPGEKKSESCTLEAFQLDMSATEFGVCAKCGWKKQDHKPASETSSSNSRARPLSIRKDGPPEPCNNYRLDLTAATFGACVCGFARQAHVGQGSNHRAVSTTLEKRWNHMKEVIT